MAIGAIGAILMEMVSLILLIGMTHCDTVTSVLIHYTIN